MSLLSEEDVMAAGSRDALGLGLLYGEQRPLILRVAPGQQSGSWCSRLCSDPFLPQLERVLGRLRSTCPFPLLWAVLRLEPALQCHVLVVSGPRCPQARVAQPSRVLDGPAQCRIALPQRPLRPGEAAVPSPASRQPAASTRLEVGSRVCCVH